MKTKYRILLMLIGLAGLKGQEYASYAGGFLRMGASARSMAMGSSFTAEIDNGFTAYHNPASIVFTQKRQVGFAHHFMPLSRRFMAASFSAILPPTAGLGIAWISAGTDNIDGRTTAGEHTQYLSTAEDAVFFTFGQKITDWLSVGINVKILNHQLPMNSGDLAGKGTGMDIGVFIQTESGANLAFMVQDLDSKYQWNTDGYFERGRIYSEPFPTIFRVGTTKKWDRVYLTGDFGFVRNGNESLGYIIRFGGETTFRDKYFLRAGFGNGRMSVGMGLDWSFLKQNDARLDYAFILEAPAGVTHVFTYAFSF